MRRIQFLFLQRTIDPAHAHGDVEQAAGREAGPRRSESGQDDLDHRQTDLGPRLVEDEDVEAAGFQGGVWKVGSAARSGSRVRFQVWKL